MPNFEKENQAPAPESFAREKEMNEEGFNKDVLALENQSVTDDFNTGKKIEKLEEVELEEWIDFEKDVKKIQEKLLNKLETEEVIKVENGIKIINLEKFCNFSVSDFYLGKIDGRVIYGSRDNVFKLFYDLKFVSEEDYEKSKEEGKVPIEKPLFNIPDSKDGAYNLENIRNNNDYYLNYWDISSNKKNIYWDREILARNGEKINLREFHLANDIYKVHKGVRRKKENGEERIFVLNMDELDQGDGDSYEELNYDWLNEKYSISSSIYRGNNKVDSGGIHKYILENYKDLIQYNLLKLSDFRSVALRSGEKTLRKEYAPSSEKTELSLYSARYYLGRGEIYSFLGERVNKDNLKFAELDSETIGVIFVRGERESLKYVINLLSDREKEEMRNEIHQKMIEKHGKNSNNFQIGPNMYLNKKEVEQRTKKFNISNLIKKRSEESIEEYNERVAELTDYRYVKEVSNRFLLDTGISIHKLPWREQVWFASAEFELSLQGKYDKLVEFVKIYKEDGLRVFLSCEDNINNAEKILEIGKNIEQAKARKLFQKYQEIIDQAKMVRQEVKTLFKAKRDVSEAELDKITETILKKANHLLLDYSRRIGAGEKIDEAEMLAALEEYDSELVFVASVWKNIDKTGLNFEDMKGIEFEHLVFSDVVIGNSMDIVKSLLPEKDENGDFFLASPNARGAMNTKFADASEEEKNRASELMDMIRIYQENYKQKPSELREVIVSSFIGKLESKTINSSLYSYKKDGRVLAFNRFDDLGNGKKYFGSFNVKTDIQDSAIGSALLFRVLEQEAQNALIEADCSFLDDVGRFYVEKCGFIAKKCYEYYKEPSLSIERDEKKYRFTGFSKDDIMHEYMEKFNDNSYKPGEENVILKFSKNSAEKMKIVGKLLNDGEYVMTRYFSVTEGEGKNKKEYDYCAFEKAA